MSDCGCKKDEPRISKEGQILPSASSAIELVSNPGSIWAWIGVARDMLLRALVIGAGLYIGGARQGIFRLAISGAMAIEIAVIFLTWKQLKG